MKYKKMTRKEVESKLVQMENALSFAFNRLKELEKLYYSVGKTLNEYVKFKKDTDKFLKYAEKEMAKEEKRIEKDNEKYAKLQKKDEDNKPSNG